jgi:hypothetical protein
MATVNESSAVTREWAMPHLSVEEHAARGKAERAGLHFRNVLGAALRAER